MKRIILIMIFGLCSSVINANMPSLAPMLEKIMPAIVNISIQGSMADPNDDEEPQHRKKSPKKFQSLGSGVILEPNKGYIVTNAHVIRHAKIITVTLHDGRRLQANLIGADNESDIAILQVKAKRLTTLNLADSNKAQVGDYVVAIGNPFGLNNYGNNQSATFGIISAMQRSDLNIEGLENFIQTDAAINPGNSGGALVNTSGELIGINTAILAPFGGNVGIGFAIPINMVQDVAQQLIKYGSVHRGLMGIFVQHLTPELAHAFGLNENSKGALITQVNQDSPAQKAGLRSGDIILNINGRDITEASQVKTNISLLRVGQTVHLKILRNKQILNLKATVSDIKEHEHALQKAQPFLFGLALSDFERSLPLHGNVVGVQVVGASETSAGFRAGLRTGDVIVSANQQETKTVASLQNISTHSKDQLLLHILRGPGSLFIIVK